MAGTTLKKTQKAKAKKQAQKVKSTTVSVVVKTQAIAVNSKTAGKRAPRRKTDPTTAAAAPAREAVPAICASVFNTSLAREAVTVIARQPVYDFPVQYEPSKAPATDVQRVEALSSPIISKPTFDGITDITTPSISPFSTPAVNRTPEPQVPIFELTTKKKLYDYANQNGISGVNMKMNKPEMIAKIRNFQP